MRCKNFPHSIDDVMHGKQITMNAALIRNDWKFATKYPKCLFLLHETNFDLYHLRCIAPVLCTSILPSKAFFSSNNEICEAGAQREGAVKFRFCADALLDFLNFLFCVGCLTDITNFLANHKCVTFHSFFMKAALFLYLPSSPKLVQFKVFTT